MLLTILKYKLYQARNFLTHSSSKKKLGWLISIAFIVPYYNMVIRSMSNIYGGIYKNSDLHTMYQLASANVGMIFLFVLVSSTALTMYRTFQSKDLSLLMSLPTRDSSLFLTKLFDSLSDTARTMILPFPVCIAFIITISKFSSPFAGITFLIGWIFVMVQLAGLSIIISLILGKFMIYGRLGNLMRVAAVLIAMTFLVILMLYVQRTEIGSSSRDMPNFLPFSGIPVLSTALPASWLIQLMPSSGSGPLSRLTYGLIFVIFTLACPTIAFWLFRMRFRRLWAMTLEVTRKGVRKSKARKATSGIRSMGKTRSLILKEVRFTFREPHIFMGLFLPLILFPVFFLLSGRQTENQPLYIVIAALLTTASFSISCIGREGRTFSLLRALPISMSLLLRAKLLLNWIVNLFVTIIFVLAFYIFQRLTLNQLLYNLLIAIIASFYFSVIGTAIAALFPKFDFVNPIRAVTMPGMLGLYFTAGLFSVTVVGMRYVNWYFIPLILVPWTIIALVLMKISEKRLERIDL